MEQFYDYRKLSGLRSTITWIIIPFLGTSVHLKLPVNVATVIFISVRANRAVAHYTLLSSFHGG